MRRSAHRNWVGVAILAAWAWMVPSAPAGSQGISMPDARQMSGIPLPAGDLPDASVSVRVVRGTVDNNIEGQTVELHGGPSVLTLRTDESGRVQFTGLTPGTRVHAVATVGSERLESQAFDVPARGGIRVMLVAGDPASEKRAAEEAALAASAPQPGSVVLGGQSEFVVELDDDALVVYYLLQIVNTARTPVQPSGPLVFDLPIGARAVTILEGSSPLATANGPRITVTGPFPPGNTAVQAAYSLPYSGDTLQIAQTLPATLEQLSLVVQKVGATHFTSPQIATHGEMPAEGKTYLVGNGPAVAQGDTLTIDLTGLPHRPTWPRTTAILLAVGILLAGVWASIGVGRDAEGTEGRRRKLEDRRERLFADLTRIERQHRLGQIDEKQYRTRRRVLVARLERVYSGLDEHLAA